MGPHRKLGIYVGYSSLSIIKYLESLIGDLFTTWFANYNFNEDHFLRSREELYQQECQEIDWNVEGISFSDPRTIETELQVQRIIDLQNIANNLPDAFSNYKGVTKSLHPARNVVERVEVPNKTTHPQIGKKRGRSTSKRQDVIAGKQKKTQNATQPLVERHLEDIQCPMDRSDPQSSLVMRINTKAGTSEDPRFIISGSHDGS